MTPTIALPLPAVPADVAAFAAENGVSEYLPKVLALARRLFPTEPMSVTMYQDYDVADLRWILIEVQVPFDTDYSISVRPRHDAFNRAMFEICPATHVHNFGLSPDAVP